MRSKYNATKVKADGYTFDSKKEYARYLELKDLEKNGVITNLQMHPKFVLEDGFCHDGKKYRAITYSADFQYELNGETIIEDVKSPITKKNKVYQLKKKMMLKRGYEIKEV